MATSPSATARGSLGDALRDWQTLLGTAHVVVDGSLLQAASTATFATTPQVLAILRPASREEVQAVLRIANRHEIPLFPISTGKNWGYGSRVPWRDSVLLDLGRMRRILDFDEDLGYVTVEPGVTQRQLFEYLRSRHSRLWMDATGASPDCSIIGNTLERGFGHTPMGDHCGNACGLEVVLPTGECLETGFARFEGARTGPMSRWGVGPALDGLFSQSNLGVVTRMSVWLMPAPEHFEAFFFSVSDESGLGPIIDALRPLRMSGTLRSVMHIGNDYKVLAATSQFPWAEGHSVPLGLDYMKTVRSRLGFGAWNGSGGLYGTKVQVREARRLLRRALAGKVDRLQFVDRRLLGLLQRFSGAFSAVTRWDLSRTVKVLVPVYDLMRGVPTDSTLASAYWRKKSPPPTEMDPDRDGCGLMWCSPAVPNSGAAATEITALAADVLLRFGFEPQISISMATERLLICVITISYDRGVAGEDARAHACYRALAEESLARGFPPYRHSVVSTQSNLEQQGYVDAIAALKAAWDPHDVLAPGRYGIDSGRRRDAPVTQ